MADDRKKIGLFIIILGVVIIALIVYLFFIKGDKPSDPFTGEEESVFIDETFEPASNPRSAPIDYSIYDLSKEEPRETTADDLGKLSMSVAERFGSFSSQSNYGNFTDLKILMTNDMRTWVDSYIIELRSKSDTGSATYYGITTKAINYQVRSFDDKAGQAEIIVNTQRRESRVSINDGEPYSQDLRLALKKVNGEWLFDAAYWSK